MIASVAVAFGAGAGSPLFVLYQREWGFPDWQLTTAFTVYAVTLLATLLVAGSVSDHIGRR
ncbi:MFS transporter, partial [Streptomyces sp. TRM76130]|nr:MFS transporter [Streptomyces sp. TRM76130]